MREPPKLLSPADLEIQPVVSNEQILLGHGDNTKGLYKAGKTVSGRDVVWANVGRFLAKIDPKTGEYMADDIHKGWMIGTGRWINSQYNSAFPKAEKVTWVLHHRNRFSSDIHNNAGLVIIPPKLLVFLYKHSGRDKDFYAMGSGGEQDAAINFMQGVLLQNGFLPENMGEVKKLHELLEKNTMLVALPDPDREHEDLERFQPVSPFPTARVEVDGGMEDGMTDLLENTYEK